MSVWFCSKEHIDLIVTNGIALGVIDGDDGTRMGNILWQENCRSLRYYYGDKAEDMGCGPHGELPADGEYVYTPAPDENLAGLYSAWKSYDYQSCECPCYVTTTAGRVADGALLAILKKLDGEPKHSSEYWNCDEYPVRGGVES